KISVDPFARVVIKDKYGEEIYLDKYEVNGKERLQIYTGFEQTKKSLPRGEPMWFDNDPIWITDSNQDSDNDEYTLDLPISDFGVLIGLLRKLHTPDKQ